VHEYNISSILRAGTAVHKSFEPGLAEATRTTNPLARDVDIFSYDYDLNVLNHAGSEDNSSSAPFSTTAVSFCCSTSASVPGFSGLHWLPPYVPVAGGSEATVTWMPEVPHPFSQETACPLSLPLRPIPPYPSPIPALSLPSFKLAMVSTIYLTAVESLIAQPHMLTFAKCTSTISDFLIP
jgi:hypothetical protein